MYKFATNVTFTLLTTGVIESSKEIHISSHIGVAHILIYFEKFSLR